MPVDRLKFVVATFVENLAIFYGTSAIGMNKFDGSTVSDSKILTGGLSILIVLYICKIYLVRYG